ncbi:dephospho-CoA kinase [Clostridium subterminale]|uniref:Dephospho-CoA kinase n=1 Tax=Clostridium subterminale TaxID=1550 RepID=A0ABN1KZB8_CLOSU
MKQSNILKIGLTGGIGCGKSTISMIFRENSIPVIDADEISRKVLLNHPDILLEIRKSFGDEYFDENGEFLRRKMGNLIFSDKSRKVQYENIIMPHIFHDILSEIKKYNDVGEEICIIDAPTLIENKLHTYMDKIIVVIASEEIQIERVTRRDNFSREEAIIRINNQMSTKEKCKFADFIIDNSGNLQETRIKVMKVISKLKLIRGKNDL